MVNNLAMPTATKSEKLIARVGLVSKPTPPRSDIPAADLDFWTMARLVNELKAQLAAALETIKRLRSSP